MQIFKVFLGNVFTNIDIKTVIPKLQLTLANVVSNFVLRQEMGE